MKRLNMSYKQAFGALYAISKFLDLKDEESLSMEFLPDDEYARGFRAGQSSLIDSITTIMNRYQSREATE